MKQLQDNMEKLFNGVFSDYDTKGKDLLTIKYKLMNAVNTSFWEHAKKNYWIISWDSPIGEDSETILKALGFVVTWNGIPGYRGDVILFLPKDKYKTCPKDIKEWFNTLVKIDNNYERILSVFDSHSQFTIKGAKYGN